MPDIRPSDTVQTRSDRQDETRQRLDAIRHRKVIIYGAGKIGQRVYEALRRLDVPIDSIWDINASQIGTVGNAEVIEPEPDQICPEERNNFVVIITIFSEKVAESVRKSLLEAGYVNVIVDRTFINDLLLLDCHDRISHNNECVDINNCVFCPRITTKNSSCSIFFRHITNALEEPVPDDDSLCAIPSMGVLTTTRCTLTCSGCNHLRDHFKPENNINIPFTDIASDLAILLHSVDVINKLVIVGGEAFLHPELSSILDHVLSLRKVGIVHIITNGTVVPKDERLLCLLAHKRVIVEVSGYGDRLPQALQANVASFMDTLVHYNVNHRHTRTMQWFDFGGFEARDYSEEQLSEVYSACCFVSNDLFNGRLYTCSRSALGSFLGKLPDYEGDYVQIRGAEQSELRKNLIAFFEKKYAKACRHCNGTTAVTIEAGRQTRTIRPASSPATSARAGKLSRKDRPYEG